MAGNSWKYLPLGDSYTIGESVSKECNFPHLLAKKCAENTISMEILAEPAVTGFTTQQVIELELPLVTELKPDLITLCIGVNDWVQEVALETFRNRFSSIIQHILLAGISKKHIWILTIPDFSLFPEGYRYAKGRNISEGIAHFNGFIIEFAQKENLPLVDVANLCLQHKNDPTWVASDGLHPSEMAYEAWAKAIFDKMMDFSTFTP